MKQYETAVIHNGVDTEIFKSTANDVRERYGCIDKKVILGVAAIWDRRKGLDTFIELSKKLDASCQIILVGLTKEQIEKLPKNIIGIKNTSSVRELVELYSAADVFVNPTLEDNYPTTNIEAIASGTPVVSYDTGGSGESARMYGKVVERKMEELLIAIRESDLFTPQNIMVDYRETVREYLKLYEDVQ